MGINLGLVGAMTGLGKGISDFATANMDMLKAERLAQFKQGLEDNAWAQRNAVQRTEKLEDLDRAEALKREEWKLGSQYTPILGPDGQPTRFMTSGTGAHNIDTTPKRSPEDYEVLRANADRRRAEMLAYSEDMKGARDQLRFATQIYTSDPSPTNLAAVKAAKQEMDDLRSQYSAYGGLLDGSLDGTAKPAPRAGTSEKITVDPEKIDKNVSEQYMPLIQQNAAQQKLDPGLVTSMIAVESSFNPNAVSPTKMTGLMQTGIAATKDVGGDPTKRTDPASSIEYGTKYLALLRDQVSPIVKEGDPTKWMLAAYKGGMEAVKASGGDWNKLPEPTRNYTMKVLNTWAAHTGKAPPGFQFAMDQDTGRARLVEASSAPSAVPKKEAAAGTPATPAGPAAPSFELPAAITQRVDKIGAGFREAGETYADAAGGLANVLATNKTGVGLFNFGAKQAAEQAKPSPSSTAAASRPSTPAPQEQKPRTRMSSDKANQIVTTARQRMSDRDFATWAAWQASVDSELMDSLNAFNRNMVESAARKVQ